MGAVYEVEHARTGDRLALKLLLSRVGSSREALERFKREARASARIKSDNVVRVIDADVAPELGDAPFLVMELLEGSDLERLADKGRPAAADVVDWLRQAARAIDKAHRLGIVHRDLKPENLFLAKSEGRAPVVKVLDFGIAKMIEEGTGATGSGQILGTPKYMAPEQASSGTRVTPAADRCALGLIAYRLLAGESYYRGDLMSILGDLVHGKLEAPSARGHALGAAFDAWFMKACHRDPEQRFASAAAQMEALAAALGLPVGAEEGPGAMPTRRTASALWKGRARAVVLGGIVLGAASLAIVLAGGPKGTPKADRPAAAPPVSNAAPSPAQGPIEVPPAPASQAPAGDGAVAAVLVEPTPKHEGPPARATTGRPPRAARAARTPAADPFADQK